MYNDGRLSGVSIPVLTNCVLQGNSAAGHGGAMLNNGSSNGQSIPVLTNCSLQGNSAAGFGGAMYNIGSNGVSSPVVVNCVLWDNRGSNSVVNSSATVQLRYSLYEPVVVTTGVDITGPGNLTTTTSPFVSTASTMLTNCALAIGSADPATTSATVGTTDLAGNARFTNGRLDIGAYQYQGEVFDQVRAITVQPVAGTAVSAGTSVSIPVSATGLGTSFSYQWYKGVALLSGQTSATLSLPMTTTADEGTYRVVISSSCNSLTSTTFSLTVDATPTVAGFTTLDNTVCAGSPITFTATVGIVTGSYTYTITNGTSTSIGTTSNTSFSQTLTASGSGVQTFTLTVADNGASAIASTTVTVNALPSLTVTASPSLVITAGGSVNLTASGADQYVWSNASTANPLIVSNVTSATVLSVTGTTGGCSATASVAVSVTQPASVILAGTATGSISACAGTASGNVQSFTVSASNLSADLVATARRVSRFRPSRAVASDLR
ncbi:hypothetical protein GO730_37410 [Spirosoma sp. HMF3257]|uniref:Ig-like domain-containing protein n=1 Tax=Spirosoma telluris TaxID=2183553 RepID=A0A327NCU4_9BACT|nr:hypothetical protein [Spirosoma telluris]RAI73070.1 hypothetical protein HMF3257_37335 [Spirosoma telluris]